MWCYYYYCEPSDYVVWNLTRTALKSNQAKMQLEIYRKSFNNCEKTKGATRMNHTRRSFLNPPPRGTRTGRDGTDRTGQDKTDGRTDGRDEVGEKRNQSLRGNNTKIFRRNALKQTANYVDCQVSSTGLMLVRPAPCWRQAGAKSQHNPGGDRWTRTNGTKTGPRIQPRPPSANNFDTKICHK